MRQAGAKPPELKVSRTSPNEAVINYTSARKMCSVAKGITKGVAKHYNERILIIETTCMLRGNQACNMSVRLVG